MALAPQFKSKRQQKIWEQQQREAAVQRENPSLYENQSPFRQAERHYKHATDFSDVYDFQCLENNIPANRDEIVEIELALDLRDACPYPLGDPHDIAWIPRRRKAYTLKKCPGLVVIPNPLGAHEQRQLIRQCLSDYARPPNKSNLDPHYLNIPSQGLWQTHMTDPTAILTKRSDHSDVPIARLIPKLRWVTLGYQYNWTTKEYELNQRYPVPQSLADLTETVVRAIPNTVDTTIPRHFKAEAGIVNFYQLRDTLQGHVDRSEEIMDAPLVSLSLGHSCIYLLGGPSKEENPVPMFLRSGDIIVMTGPCRKAYHGVPRIVENTLPDYLREDSSTEDWKPFGAYMRTSRINLNIRQVFNP